MRADPAIAPALATDLYELTMAAGYVAGGRHDRATFELWVRRVPPQRGYLVAAGIERALDYLASLRFTAGEIEYLRRVPNLQGAPAEFFDRYLAEFRFTGDVSAMDEGTPFFGNEPILQVSAPLPQAQLVETALLTLVMHPTLVASKASRVVDAADGRGVVEFGSRRAHGIEAAVQAAYAAYLAGCAGTSCVEAGYRYGIPVSGTMAHSWVMSFEDEIEAFRAYERVYGARSVFLIDTYDTCEAARKIVRARLSPGSVRLDSGDAATLAREVRAILDEGGLRDVTIFLSGDLDEFRIYELVAGGAPIDGFGVGTALSASIDVPALGIIYKLVELEARGARTATMKLSEGKATYPGRKQVFRTHAHGISVRDVIALADEPPPAGATPLLRPRLRDGRRIDAPPALDELRTRTLEQRAALPESVRRLRDPSPYPVGVSDALESLARDVTHRLRR